MEQRAGVMNGAETISQAGTQRAGFENRSATGTDGVEMRAERVVIQEEDWRAQGEMEALQAVEKWQHALNGRFEVR